MTTNAIMACAEPFSSLATTLSCKPLPLNLSTFFAPVPGPSIKTAVDAMSLAVLNVMLPR